MKYIALLRGINVGKGPRVDMKKLKGVFEALDHTNVSTYINSGNVFFETERTRADKLRKAIESGLEKEFGFHVPVLVKTQSEIKKIASIIPAKWKNDAEQKTDIAYLFPEIDSKKALDAFLVKKEFIDISYVKGAIIWNLKKKEYNKSHLNKIMRLKHYQFMTVRNVNTARYLAGNKK